MARTGRPPKPVEIKRRTGNPGKRPLPALSNVVALKPAAGKPEYPTDLEVDGKQLWDRAWDIAITWLSPQSDMRIVEDACRLADDVAVARKRYRATTDPGDARALITVQKQLVEALSALGFTPTARSRLGVAEVRRVSELEKLISKRGNA
ncbi:MAG TPA: hypothetical protein VIV12_09100 [Streptosporangiaceae bacterium]